MPVRSLVCSVLVVAWMFGSPHADVGSGSGKPITPYQPPDDVTSARVAAARLVCNAGELSMVGTSWTTETVYRQLFRVRDMQPGVEIEISNTSKGDGHWWAIRSVTADQKYPYRVVMKK